MESNKIIKITLSLITLALWIIVLQNARIIKPVSKDIVLVGNTVDINGSVEVENTVDINGSVEVENTVDVNLDQVVGYQLVTTQRGMHIGVSSTENTVIPVDWGEIGITR